MKTTNAKRKILDEFAQQIDTVKIETGEKSPIEFRDDFANNIRRDVYKIATEYLKFRKDNGRIASDVLTYETSKGDLKEATDYGQSLLKSFLDRKDPEKNRVLLNSLLRSGQKEIAVITADGYLINGNRRKLALEILQDRYPANENFRYLKVVILPGFKTKEEGPSLKEIEQIENRYQLQALGKAEYYNFDKGISIKRKIELGIPLEDQLLDDPNFSDLPEKQFKQNVSKFRDEFLEPLKAIDRYLFYYNRVGHYNTISEGRTDSKGRWQAFRDYYNIVYKKVSDNDSQKKLGLNKKDLAILEDIAFKIIRKRDLGELRKKVHNVMRDLVKIYCNKEARKVLFTLRGDKNFLLEEWEMVDENGLPLDEKTKDLIWSNKFGDLIISTLQHAYEIYNAKNLAESPIKAFDLFLVKINKMNFDIKAMKGTDIRKLKNSLQLLLEKLNDINNTISKNKARK